MRIISSGAVMSVMSATSGGGRGRGRGTGKETGPERTVIGMGRGRSRQITTPPSPIQSTVPPEIEEQVRAQQAEMKGKNTLDA